MPIQLSKDEVIELVTQAQAGDEAAFAKLYDLFFEPVVRFCWLRVGDRDEAEDLAQKTFVKFYRNLAGWRDQGYSPAAYIYTVARSAIADHFRSAHRHNTVGSSEEILALLPDTSQSAQDNVIARVEIAQVMKGLSGLDSASQELLQLRYIEGLSGAEIAHILGKSPVATRKAISRALQKLRQQLNQQLKAQGE